MKTKTCRLCGQTKPFDEFYTGLRQCKPCYRAKVTKNRNENIDHYRAYDRKRGFRNGDNYMAEYRKKFPNKYKAQTMVNNAIRDKRLFRQPCETCGTTESIHGHHDDYLKPLNVRWLCAAHHAQWHRDNDEGLNP